METRSQPSVAGATWGGAVSYRVYRKRHVGARCQGFFGLFSVPSRTSLLLCEMGELGGGVSLVSWWWR